jgi:hypothetical protein
MIYKIIAHIFNNSLNVGHSYFHMSSAVRLLFRYEAKFEARGFSRVMQNRSNT